MAGFKAERRSIRQSENALERDRMSDFRFAGSQLDAIYGALAKTRRKVGKRITVQNERILARMAGIVAKQRQGSRRAIGAEAESVRRYGGAIAGAVGEQFKPGSTVAKSGVKDALAGQAVGLHEAKTDQTILGIAEAGAAEARAGADYALSQALAERTNQDVALIAQQKHDLAMAKLQQRFAIEMAEKQADLELRNAKKLADAARLQEGTGAAGATLVAEDLAALYPEVRSALYENPEMSVADIMATLDVPAGGELYVAQLIRVVKNRGLQSGDTGSYAASVDAILDTMLFNNPEWRKKPKLIETLKKAIDAMLRSTFNRQLAATERDALDSPDYARPPVNAPSPELQQLIDQQTAYETAPRGAV